MPAVPTASSLVGNRPLAPVARLRRVILRHHVQ